MIAHKIVGAPPPNSMGSMGALLFYGTTFIREPYYGDYSTSNKAAESRDKSREALKLYGQESNLGPFLAWSWSKSRCPEVNKLMEVQKVGPQVRMLTRPPLTPPDG